MGTDQIPIDESLITELKQFDYDLDYSQKCIEANKHNHITATYNLLLKSKIREGKMTMKEAYECKNDLTSLMKRHPRFQDLNHNMPEHLKLSSRKEHKVSSMPPKTRVPNDETDEADTTETNNEAIKTGDKITPKPLKIDNDVQKEIKNKRRMGSTGGSSAKDAEIIGKEQKKNSGSPSPSPIGHPQFPLSNKAPLLKQVLASNNPNVTISDSNSSKNTKLVKRDLSNNSKNEISKKRVNFLKNQVDFSHLFKNKNKNHKKRKSQKGISQSDLSAATPMGIGNLAPPPISIGFGLSRGRHKKAATAFNYENMNNSFQVEKLKHNTITATPSQRNKKKRKGSKKVRVS